MTLSLNCVAITVQADTRCGLISSIDARPVFTYRGLACHQVMDIKAEVPPDLQGVVSCAYWSYLVSHSAIYTGMTHASGGSLPTDCDAGHLDLHNTCPRCLACCPSCVPLPPWPRFRGRPLEASASRILLLCSHVADNVFTPSNPVTLDRHPFHPAMSRTDRCQRRLCALAQLLVICLTFQVLCTIVAIAGINVDKGRITGFILSSASRSPSATMSNPGFASMPPLILLPSPVPRPYTSTSAW